MKGRIVLVIISVAVACSTVIFMTTLAKTILLTPNSHESYTGTTTGQAIDLPRESENTASTSDYPERIQIPSLHIDARVEHVGIKPNGNMATPKKYSEVAWYRLGTVPGFRGSAVIAGHVDNGLALAGVFKRLDELKIGEDISIVSASGTVTHFTVSDIKRYPHTEVPNDLLFNRADVARLNLVTCAGKWIPQEKTYDQRLIVFAEKVLREQK